MGFPDSPVHDIKALVSVTINGQLFLMMLIESLVTNGIRAISANTDGIVSIVPKDKSDLYYKLCEEWSKIVNFELEFTHYELYSPEFPVHVPDGSWVRVGSARTGRTASARNSTAGSRPEKSTGNSSAGRPSRCPEP